MGAVAAFTITPVDSDSVFTVDVDEFAAVCIGIIGIANHLQITLSLKTNTMMMKINPSLFLYVFHIFVLKNGHFLRYFYSKRLPNEDISAQFLAIFEGLSFYARQQKFVYV